MLAWEAAMLDVNNEPSEALSHLAAPWSTALQGLISWHSSV